MLTLHKCCTSRKILLTWFLTQDTFFLHRKVAENIQENRDVILGEGRFKKKDSLVASMDLGLRKMQKLVKVLGLVGFSVALLEVELTSS